MNIRKLLVSAVLPMLCASVSAQTADNTPVKGDWTIAATLGYNSFTNVSALPGNLNNYEGAALNTNNFDKKLMVGFEAGYFVGNNWKLNLGGGLNFTHNPGYGDVPGTVGDLTGEDAIGEIPNYRAVASQYSCVYNVNLGLDRYFALPVQNLMCYTGVKAGFAYALNEAKYDEWMSMGKSVGETWNLRGSLVFGIDYYVTPAMFVGMSVEPFQYTYNMTTYRPQEGLASLQADSSNFAILAAPTLKLGFKF